MSVAAENRQTEEQNQFRNDLAVLNELYTQHLFLRRANASLKLLDAGNDCGRTKMPPPTQHNGSYFLKSKDHQLRHDCNLPLTPNHSLLDYAKHSRHNIRVNYIIFQQCLTYCQSFERI